MWLSGTHRVDKTKNEERRTKNEYRISNIEYRNRRERRENKSEEAVWCARCQVVVSRSKIRRSVPVVEDVRVKCGSGQFVLYVRQSLGEGTEARRVRTSTE
jgi:hypothetical protein